MKLCKHKFLSDIHNAMFRKTIYQSAWFSPWVYTRCLCSQQSELQLDAQPVKQGQLLCAGYMPRSLPVTWCCLVKHFEGMYIFCSKVPHTCNNAFINMQWTQVTTSLLSWLSSITSASINPLGRHRQWVHFSWKLATPGYCYDMKQKVYAP